MVQMLLMRVQLVQVLFTKGGSIADYSSSLANSIDLVVSCRKLGDGSRHVMAIEELTGRILPNGMAETSVLFRYNLTGEVDRDPETGRLEKIHGYFEQVNPISKDLVSKFFSAGISKDQIQQFMNPPEIVEGKSNLPSQQLKEMGVTDSSSPSFI